MMRKNARWSYTEIVIITVVLGVFAIRVVPQVTEANPESRVGELIDGVQKMRIQLDLYRAQHCGCLPDVGSFEAFESAVTKKTGQNGPYVSKIPTNPFNSLNTVRFDGEPAGAGMAGWRLDTENGVFQADDSVSHAGL
jgi:hypothetical protein